MLIHDMKAKAKLNFNYKKSFKKTLIHFAIVLKNCGFIT